MLVLVSVCQYLALELLLLLVTVSVHAGAGVSFRIGSDADNAVSHVWFSVICF